VALDVHKKEHWVGMLLPGQEKAQEWSFPNDPQSLRKMVARVRKAAPDGVLFCYEAGPTGFALQRDLKAMGEICHVIAPSLIPSKPGERVKSDRRDVRKMAPLFKAGLLTEVRPPTVEDESIRDLCRCREAAKKDLLRARHRLVKWLLRHGIVYQAGEAWTRKYADWLRSLKFEVRLEEQVFIEYLNEVTHQEARVERLDQEMESTASTSQYAKAVGFLRCFRGIDTITALSITAELYDFARFTSPRELMGFIGAVPSEHSSGESQHRGGITKTGNSRVRRLLVEASWHQGKRPVISKALKKRRKDQPDWVIAVADRALYRLNKRYNRLVNRGKPPVVAVTAVARELAGFLWAVLHTKQAGMLTSESLS
jgi:transposase